MAFDPHPHPVSLRHAGEAAGPKPTPHALRARVAAAALSPPARAHRARGPAGAASAVTAGDSWETTQALLRDRSD